MPAAPWLVSTLACGFMTGLIWFVQVVHYPLFARVGRDAFEVYEASHTRLTTLVVGPAMLIELLGTAWLTAAMLDGALLQRTLAIVAAGLLGVAWASTLLVQVPLHGRLTAGFDERSHRLLVRTNWARTFAWTTRLGVLVWLGWV